MGEPSIPKNVKLIVGLISNRPDLFEKVGHVLEKRFKTKVDFRSALMNFDHTDYYNEEMGDGLKRGFLSLEKLFDLKKIHRIKLETNSIEKRLSKFGRRTINIDPGYLDLSKVVLFSTKNHSHRIYIDEGIFAEVALFYKDGTFNPWPWTYPDYRTKSYIDIFNSIREIYRKTTKS